MAIVEKEPTYFCDICKKEFDKNELHVDECRVNRISLIQCEVWYKGFIQTQHICKNCSQKILSYMHQIEPKIEYHKWVKLLMRNKDGT